MAPSPHDNFFKKMYPVLDCVSVCSKVLGSRSISLLHDLHGMRLCPVMPCSLVKVPMVNRAVQSYSQPAGVQTRMDKHISSRLAGRQTDTYVENHRQTGSQATSIDRLTDSLTHLLTH